MSEVKPRSWDEIILTLDLDKVAAEINAVEAGQPEMPDYERRDVRELVLLAAERWLPNDLVELHLDGVEEAHDGTNFRGILDLRGRHKGVLKAYQGFAGAGMIADWKTTKGALDADWANRYKYSWQWKLYAMAFPETRLFHYRGISRSGDMRDVVIEIPPEVAGEAAIFVDQVQEMRRSLFYENMLYKNGPHPWPRKMPSSCRAYGRDCDFKDTCWNNITVPGSVDINKALSYSSIETFLLCPEKHRLTQISGYGEDDEVLAFGKAFHRGIAEIYNQAFKRKS